jgi:ERF superfamily
MSNSYKNVAAKVLKMIKSVGEIPRNGSNPQFNYRFVKETDVADKLREACMSVGLVIIPSAHSVQTTVLVAKDTTKKDSYRTSLMLKLTLVDPDTGEAMEMDFPGEAIDSQDKATPKAITSAYKYALLKLAMNGGGDGDDLEHESNEQGGGDAKETKAKPVQQGATYRKPDETGKAAGKPAPANVGQPAPAAQPAPISNMGTAEKPADKPLSTQTAPAAKQESSGGDEVPIMEDQGVLTSVVPAMKGKPAAISFKSDRGTPVYPINFDPKVTDVPSLLTLLNAKKNVKVVCDISAGNPFLMSIGGV